MSLREIVRCITPKSVLGGYPKPFEPGVTYVPLFRVFGNANGVKPTKSAYGESVKLVGKFEAVRISDGELTTAPMLILPSPMNEVIAAAVTANPGGGGVEFGFEVGVKPGTVRQGKAPSAYEWVTKNLIEQADADPLAALRATVLALPAPEVEKAKASKGQ